MKKDKKIVIITLIIATIMCLIGLITSYIYDKNHINQVPNNNEQNINRDNLIDRSEEEQAIREKTKNPYYTINNSKKLATDHKYENLDIKYPRLVRLSEKIYSFSCQINNQTEKDYPKETVVVTFIDNKGNVLSKEKVEIPPIARGQNTMILLNTEKDILKAYDFTITTAK